jgi:murein DD-endopeptidase MepM/ murein hydrolase activator NlpD
MNSMRHLRRLVVVLAFAMATFAPVSVGAQTKQDVADAEAKRDRAYQELVAANDELEAALQRLEEITGKLHNLIWRIDELPSRVTEYEDQVAGLESEARQLVVEAYTSGGRDLITAAFMADSIQDLMTSQVLIDKATTHDLVSLDRFQAVSREMDRLKLDLDDKEDEVSDLQAQQAEVVALTDELQQKAAALFNNADDAYRAAYARFQAEQRRRAAAEAARRRGASAGLPSSVTSGVVCPVRGGASFIDTWGAPRSGGRTHKGVDMSAPRGTPLQAMDSGSIRISSHSLGGKQVYLYSDNGIMFYYAHLDGYPSGLSSGQRVDRGQVIGYLGDTGNARGYPHLHLGMGPIGGGLVNPYPTVRAAC